MRRALVPWSSSQATGSDTPGIGRGVGFQQHPAIGILRQSVGQDAPGRAAADEECLKPFMTGAIV